MKNLQILRASMALALLCTSSALFAQEDEPQGEMNGVLEEVMVTATRRSAENILTTPVAITALTGDRVMTFAIRDLNDIASDVPGLSSGSVAGFGSAQFSMRGVSETTIIVYKESPVAVMMDDFVIPHMQTSDLEMFDIENIEVLRGPQGTLFGKNTTGGVISVRTKRPDLGENYAQTQLQYGSFGTTNANAALNLSVGDTLSFRFAGMYLNSDGYYKNNAVYGPIGAPFLLGSAIYMKSKYDGQSGAGDGSNIGGDDVFTGRAKVLWAPTDDLNLLFQYEMVRDNGDTPPIVQESQPGMLVPLWGYPVGTGDPLKRAGITNRDEDILNLNGGHQVDIDGYYLNSDWAFTDNYTLYFNAGTRKQESRLPSSYVGVTGPISLFDASRDDNRKTQQLEARVGSNLDGPFNFTTGAFFQKDDTEFCVVQIVGFLDGLPLGTPPDYFNDHPRLLCNKQDGKAGALYFDATYDVTDDFHISAGYRYSKEKKDWAGRSMRFFLGGVPVSELDDWLDGADFEKYPEGVVYNSHSWTEPSYRLVLGYDFSDDQFGYFSFNHSFKSGGYNDQLGTTLDPITDFAAEPTSPEIADSFEIGYKATSEDGAASFAIDSYFVKYKDAQKTFNVSFPDGQQETLFFNAATLDVWGIEAEGAWAVSDSFLVRWNGSYMHAQFGTFEADTDYDGIIDVDLSGKPVTRVPKWMGTVGGTYTHPIGNRGNNLEFSLRVAYEGKSIASYIDLPGGHDPFLNAKTLVDLNLTYRDSKDRYYLSLLGSNLLDDRYRTASLAVATIWVMSAYGPPRYWGIEFGGILGLDKEEMSAPSAPPPPPPPPAAPANPDLDGDGVLNEKDKCPNTRPGAVVDLDGCEVEAVISLEGVHFEFDQATLTPEAMAILDKAAGLLQSQEKVVVEVAGHTDSVGSEEYNQKLSERRAIAVKDYLESKGITANRLTAMGYGEAQPVASNDTDAGRALNRRVELIVLSR
ncbi:MAG: TonB-dependent receptor [Xanthomonadales bacterium]|nr:TonB-dependent receptor [Xanthomonadales bacterium]